jgi:hypothetical protein
MTSKKTIASRNLTTIQLSKQTVQHLRQAESYPHETYDCIIARLVEVNTALAAKLKVLEAYPREPVESIIARLIAKHNYQNRNDEQAKTTERSKVNSDKDGGGDAAEAFQRELAKITGQK